MSSQLLLIVDDLDLKATYGGGGQWGTSTFYQWYGGSITWPQFADSSTSTLTGSVLLSFDGIAIAFSGNTPSVFTDSQTLAVSIDGAPSYNTTYNDPTPQSYVQWYQSPTLPEGTHSITLSHMAGTALDYAVITAGQNTSLSGKKIVVDNEDASIRYTGSWKRNTDRFHSGSSPDGYPFHNSTHQSTTPGDNFVFRFSGTSLSIYGIMNWANLGTVSATYTLDGSTTSQTYTVTTSSSMYQKNSNTTEQIHFQLFNYATLTAGNHTLVVNITNCVNQTFIFDYMTYQPSFSTLATMPNLTLPASSGSTDSTSSTTTKSTPVGPVVGAVIGGIALLFLLIGAFLWFRKKKSQDDQEEPNQITAFSAPSSGPENLGTARSDPSSPGTPSMQAYTPSSASIQGIASTKLLQTGPTRVEHKSSRSAGGETALTSTTDVSMIGGGPITTETREARQSIAPPAYEA